MNTEAQLPPTAYDQLPYTSNPFPQTHPDRLATIATLLGMQPPPIERCRVLELGCASGGNLAPLACSLPHSEFVGLDLSACQIAEGQKILAAVGLSNVTLKQMDLLEVGAELGQFDYIIAHGVFSWVPPQVQDKILAICRDHLTPTGVAYVSYNTYPGWRLHSAIRDMMLYHTRQTAEPGERIAGARELLDFLADSIVADSTPHANFLHAYVHYVRERFLPAGDDAYLFHNELAEVNEPLYFHQFVERAAEFNLRYLAEAEFQSMLVDNLPPDVAARLRQMAHSTVELEQYMDFVRNRTFRQTLLCHQEVALKGRLAPERLADFYLSSSALPENPNLDPAAGAVEVFRAPKGRKLTTDHLLTQAAMLHLSQIWPQAVPFNDLYTAARARLNAPDEGRQVQILGANLLKAFAYHEDLVEFHVYSPPLVRQVSERPVASPLARFQALQKANTVTNLRHESVKIEGLGFHLLPCLDGSWTQSALVELLTCQLAEGQIEVQLDDPTIDLEKALPEMVTAALTTLAQAALLTS